MLIIKRFIVDGMSFNKAIFHTVISVLGHRISLAYLPCKQMPAPPSMGSERRACYLCVYLCVSVSACVRVCVIRDISGFSAA